MGTSTEFLAQVQSYPMKTVVSHLYFSDKGKLKKHDETIAVNSWTNTIGQQFWLSIPVFASGQKAHGPTTTWKNTQFLMWWFFIVDRWLKINNHSHLVFWKEFWFCPARWCTVLSFNLQPISFCTQTCLFLLFSAGAQGISKDEEYRSRWLFHSQKLQTLEKVTFINPSDILSSLWH